MLTVSSITCVRGHKPLFAPVSFSLQAGHALHLEGDNGVGKTSLLRIICGLSPADAGEVLWNGSPLNRQNPEAVDAFPVMTPQTHLVEWLVEQNALHDRRVAFAWSERCIPPHLDMRALRHATPPKRLCDFQKSCSLLQCAALEVSVSEAVSP